MDTPQMYYVYSMHPHADNVHRCLAGKFLLDENGQIHVLEDHAGFLSGLETLDHDKLARRLQSLQDSMYTEIVNMDDISSGHRSDLIHSVEASQHDDTSEEQPTVYQYHRIGINQPQELKFTDGVATLDNYQLSDVELGKMIENLRSQKATIQKVGTSSSDPMKKFEDLYLGLAKADPDLAGALGHIRTAVKEGQMHPDVLRTLTNHIFKDSMTGLGNKKAYEDMLQRPRKGIHIRLDGAKFGLVNKQFGFEKGDEAIKHMFGAVRNALDESVGRAKAKAYRLGGDEGHIHVPTKEHAASFVRALKRHLDKVPPIGGQHKLAMDVGIGESPDTAEHALIQAKTHNKARNLPLHELKTHAYSAVPGFEGHLADE